MAVGDIGINYFKSYIKCNSKKREKKIAIIFN